MTEEEEEEEEEHENKRIRPRERALGQKSAIYHSIKLPFDSLVAEKFLNVNYYIRIINVKGPIMTKGIMISSREHIFCFVLDTKRKLQSDLSK